MISIYFFFFTHSLSICFSQTTANEMEQTDLFSPVYATRNEVDVTPTALVGLMQVGLCKVSGKDGFLFTDCDSYDDINDKLRIHFTELFNYFDSRPPLIGFEATLSPWLVCIKRSGHKAGVLVLSNDTSKPNGQDIITAATINRNKGNFTETVLYLGM